jgi:heat shock protein HslJ
LNRALGELQAEGRGEELAKVYMGLDEEDLIPLPTPNPVPPTPVPAPPSLPAGCIDGMEWVSDLNLDDDNMQNPPIMQPGQPFKKGWRVRNTGTCAWDASYALVYVNGNTPYARMGGQPAQVEGQIGPGETYDFNVDLVAPLVPDTYQGFWAMRNGEGQLFGDRMWIGINVQGLATPTPLPTQTPSPNIQFNVDRTSITQGECVNFSWSVQNVQAVYFYADGQDWQTHGVPGSGSQVECPQATTNYNLRVVFTDGTVKVGKVRIDVAPAAVDAPLIAYFAVNPEGQIDPGQCVSISWDAQGQVNTTAIKRNNADLWNPAPQVGNIEDCPPGAGDYAYTLEAGGPGGTSRAQRNVNVVQPVAPQPTNTPPPATPQPAPPAINAFSVNPNQIQAGGCVQISWRVSGGTTLVQILRNGVVVLDNGPWEGLQQDCLSVEDRYAYHLLASNSSGQQLVQERTVDVQASAPQNPLAGTSWRATRYWNGMEMLATLPDTNLTASFSAYGEVNGSSGCNNYGSVYSVNGGVISIVPPSTTHRLCAEPPGIMEQERAFVGALASALTFKVEGGQLRIFDRDREVIEFVGQ